MAHSKTEFELKLVGPAADVAAICELEFMAEASLGEASDERLISTYYDTPELALHAAGLSLRIRDEAGELTLTAKLTPTGGAGVARFEHERRLGVGAPDFSTGAPQLDAMIARHRDSLGEIARTTTDRRWRLVAWEGALIEASSEVGRAERRIGGRQDIAPICEAELELLKGDREALFDLARQLIETADGKLRISTETKLDRALRGAGAPLPIKTARAPLPPEAVAADILTGAIETAAAAIASAAPMIVEMHDSDAARRLRVALRRFRSVEEAFRPIHRSDRLRDLARSAREFSQAAGAARDLDVFLTKTLPIAEKSVGPTSSLRARLEARRADAWRALAKALSGKEFGVFSLELFRAAYGAAWRTPAASGLLLPASAYAETLLDARWKKLMARGAATDFSNGESLHGLRLEMKRFRYAAQTVRDLHTPEARKPAFAAMSALQTSFGEINDAAVAQKIAEESAMGLGASAARAAGFIAGYASAGSAAAAARAQADWAAFSAAPPYWRATNSGPAITDDP